MSNSDDDLSNSATRRSFITGASLILAGLSLSPITEATPFMPNHTFDLGNVVPVLIPLDGHVKSLHTRDGAVVKTGDLIVETESIELNRATVQVSTAIELADNNATFMLGEYMSCVKNLLEITANTNSQFEIITKEILREIKAGVVVGMRNNFEIPARELSFIRAAGESRRSKRILEAYEPELEQLKFRLATIRKALLDELKTVQDMQSRMKLTAPLSGVIHINVGVGSFVQKGGLVAYIEVQK
jgi:multidrug efflux pump subunit AcrA (membrane-fusion protein)